MFTTTNYEELEYLNLVKDVFELGVKQDDRTGTGTIALFAPRRSLRFDLSSGKFPVLTTKEVPFRLVTEELLWMLRGSTDARELAAKDVHIWDAQASRANLDKLGLFHYEEGDLGPIYGHQWRHFGAEYKSCKTDYTGKGVDQLKNVIREIQKDPNSRRIIQTSWNPSDLDKVALPACHSLCQFYVHPVKNSLSCLLFQRSADLGLGLPFNITSYALFVRLLAHVTNLKPGELIIQIGNAHIYNNHIDALKMQCERIPWEFPSLIINKEERTHKDSLKELESLRYEDLTLVDYKHHKRIKMEMSV